MERQQVRTPETNNNVYLQYRTLHCTQICISTSRFPLCQDPIRHCSLQSPLPARVRSIIPSAIDLASPKYQRQYAKILAIRDRCFKETLNFAQDALGRIRDVIVDQCGAGFLARCTRTQRGIIFACIFDQHSAWLMLKLRARESKVVAFGHIFEKAVNARDRDEKKWMDFSRYSWVHLCEKVFLWQVNEDGAEAAAGDAYCWTDYRERVRMLGVGGCV